MFNHHRIIRPLLYIAVVLAAAFLVKHLHTNKSYTQRYTREFAIFGSYANLTFWAEPAKAEAAADNIHSELQKIHDIANLFDANSELAKLNRNAYANPIECSPALWSIIEKSRLAHNLTDGAFDISIGPLMKVWGFHQDRNTYPDAAEIKTALEACGLTDVVVFDDKARTVKFNHPDTYLDFGGIAKGYALDIAAQIAHDHGIRSGIIDLGGILYCFPEPPPDKSTYTIGIRNPFAPRKIMHEIPVLDQVVDTSGNYENYRQLEGRTIHHIIDPRTGYPVEHMASVTVVTDNGFHSDIYATAIFIKQDSLAERFIAANPQASVLIIRQDPDMAKAEVKAWNWPVNVENLADELQF